MVLVHKLKQMEEVDIALFRDSVDAEVLPEMPEVDEVGYRILCAPRLSIPDPLMSAGK